MVIVNALTTGLPLVQTEPKAADVSAVMAREGVDVEVTVKINSPATTVKAPVPDNPLPVTVRVPGVPVTVAEPDLAINVYVPAANEPVVFKVTRELFNAKLPPAPATVKGEVTPPP